jgi:hypothetical protein
MITRQYMTTTRHIKHLYNIGHTVDEIISIISVEWDMNMYRASIIVNAYEKEIKE